MIQDHVLVGIRPHWNLRTQVRQKRNLALNKLRQEEIARQASVDLKLKQQQNESELKVLAEDHRRKLKEFEFEGLQMEDNLSAVSEKLDRTDLTEISLQLD